MSVMKKILKFALGALIAREIVGAIVVINRGAQA